MCWVSVCSTISAYIRCVLFVSCTSGRSITTNTHSHNAFIRALCAFFTPRAKRRRRKRCVVLFLLLIVLELLSVVVLAIFLSTRASAFRIAQPMSSVTMWCSSVRGYHTMPIVLTRCCWRFIKLTADLGASRMKGVHRTHALAAHTKRIMRIARRANYWARIFSPETNRGSN